MSPIFKNEAVSRIFKGLLNSYSQVFFSDNPFFAGLLILVTFVNPYSGIAGLMAVIISNGLANHIGYDKHLISRGVYGFNSLLTALGIGTFFQHSPAFFIIVALASVLNVLISISLQGVLGKYFLPFLSMPFLITTWIVILATRSFDALAISDKGIFVLNELYKLGGNDLVKIYEESQSLPLPLSVKAYFGSLGAIFFQYNLFAGIAIAAGLLLYSRIAFVLSLIGFYSAWSFYKLLGIDISVFIYNYSGFNYILTAIAIGGYFFVPSPGSYIWAVVLTPLVSLVSVSIFNLFLIVQLPIYSLPFNFVVLLFIYSAKLRVYPSPFLSEVPIQRHSPEENLYTSLVSKSRFRFSYHIPVKLPFWGEWFVSQGHDGEHTHKQEYRHAWDFNITGEDGKQYRNKGDLLTDYFCYDKTVVAPADGVIAVVQDGIPDNMIGKQNLVDNWGNTIVIRHGEFLYSNISHLKEKSIKVNKGDHVKAGDILASCGNSGRSPYPHLHFQLQATPYMGSKTIEYPISHFITKKDKLYVAKNFDIPQKNERVSNIQINELLQKALTFTPGQIIEVDFYLGATMKKANWEVITSIINETYLWEKETGSMAYFMNDGIMFRFTHYEGNRNSLLYMAYLALYEVLMTDYEDLKVESKFPLHHVFNRHSLYVNDIIAPFRSFADSEYILKYQSDSDALVADRIDLESVVKTTSLNKNRVKHHFMVHINDKGINGINVKKFNYKPVL